MSRWTAPMVALVERLPRGARREIEDSTPVPLAYRPSAVNSFGYSPANDILSYLGVYGTDSVVHAIVSRLAESVSEAEWGLYSRTGSGEEQERTRILSAAVLDLLDHPNDFQTWAEIVESGQQHQELSGETSIILGFMGGIKYPLDMWLLRPDRIEPVPSATDFLDGWIYTAPGTGEKIPIETRELLRMRDPSPVDPYRGMGKVQALLRDLDAQRYTKEWQANFFANSARPGGVLEVDRRLSDDEWTEMRERWSEQHKGLSKAHRVAIIEHGAKWVETSFSLRDMQFAEIENVSRDKALVAFGMPKSVLGIVEDVNRANAEAGEYLYARWMVRPRLKDWRSMLNRQLLPLFTADKRLILDFEDPVPENSEQGLAELKTKADVLVELVAENFDAGKVLEMLDWPDLGWTKPEPPTVVAPPGQGEPQPPARDAVRGSGERSLGAGVDAAMRWKVKAHIDDNVCQPCADNDGHLYRNRSDAYADYPGGKGYIKCVGAQYGNACRCVVQKRRNGR